MKLDLNDELARLLVHTATVAKQIRMYTAYTPSNWRNENAPWYLLWLSDSLHNFNYLGEAVIAGNREEILRSCDYHIATLNHYQEKPSGPSAQAYAAFGSMAERLAKQSIAIFTAIRDKVLAAEPTE